MRQYPFFKIPFARGSGIVSLRLTIALAKKLRQADIVHVHAGRDLVSLPSMVLCWIGKTPYVTQTHGMVVGSRHPAKLVVDRFVMRPMLSRAKRNYALQSTERRDLRSLGVPDAKIGILANGVTAASMPAWQPTTPPNVLFVARLHPDKRVMAFAAMAQILLASGTEATFHVVGPDQGDLSRLSSFLTNLSRPHRLAYLGERSHEETLRALAGATVYVLPSDYDPFPMSLVEALAVGTPTVCTPACGIADLLLETGAGIVSGREPEELARSVGMLLGDPELQRRISHAARRLALGPLSVASIVTELEGDYIAFARP